MGTLWSIANIANKTFPFSTVSVVGMIVGTTMSQVLGDRIPLFS
jgi:hypothetical protein